MIHSFPTLVALILVSTAGLYNAGDSKGYRFAWRSAAFVGEGTSILLAADNETLLEWDITSDKLPKPRQFPTRSSLFLLARDGKTLVNFVRGGVEVVDLEKKVRRELKGLGAQNRRASISQDGRQLAWPAFFSADVTIVDLRNDKREKLASFQGKQITCTRFDDSGAKLAIGFSDGSITVMDIAAKQVHFELLATGHRGDVSALAFSADGTKLVSGSDDSQIFVWEVGTKKKIKALIGHRGEVTALEFGKRSGSLFSLCTSVGALKWDINEWEVKKHYGLKEGGGVFFALSSDEKRLFIGAFAGYLFDTESGKEIARLTGRE